MGQIHHRQLHLQVDSAQHWLAGGIAAGKKNQGAG
jgi:hypothetical protein